MNAKVFKQSIVLFISILFYTSSAFAERFNSSDTTGFSKKIVTTRGKYTLVFIVEDSSFAMNMAPRLIDLFFKVYPEEVNTFNHNASKIVTWHIGDTWNLDGKTGMVQIAATGRNHTWFNPKWFQEHPEDIDCATHELMHIVQDYGIRANLPGWLTEGIADYGRYKFGVNNIKADWSLPAVTPWQKYTHSYKVTARFLVWLEQHTKDKTIVRDLDSAIRGNTYTPDTWIALTGKSADDLWKDYTANPALELHYQ